jgi:hypothetical protein
MKSASLNTPLFSYGSLRLVRIHPFRAVLTWAAFHVFLAIATGSVSTFGFKGVLFMAAAAAIVAFVDSRRQRESMMLGNLGIPVYVVPVSASATVLACEFLLSLVVH